MVVAGLPLGCICIHSRSSPKLLCRVNFIKGSHEPNSTFLRVGYACLFHSKASCQQGLIETVTNFERGSHEPQVFKRPMDASFMKRRDFKPSSKELKRSDLTIACSQYFHVHDSCLDDIGFGSLHDSATWFKGSLDLQWTLLLKLANKVETVAATCKHPSRGRELASLFMHAAPVDILSPLRRPRSRTGSEIF